VGGCSSAVLHSSSFFPSLFLPSLSSRAVGWYFPYRAHEGARRGEDGRSLTPFFLLPFFPSSSPLGEQLAGKGSDSWTVNGLHPFPLFFPFFLPFTSTELFLATRGKHDETDAPIQFFLPPPSFLFLLFLYFRRAFFVDQLSRGQLRNVGVGGRMES